MQKDSLVVISVSTIQSRRVNGLLVKDVLCVCFVFLFCFFVKFKFASQILRKSVMFILYVSFWYAGVYKI